METDFNEFNKSKNDQWISEFTVKTKSNYVTLIFEVFGNKMFLEY